MKRRSAPKSAAPRVAESVLDWLADDESAALWVGGLAVAVGAAVGAAFPVRGESFESVEHLALGAAVPALAALLAWELPSRGAARRVRAGAAAAFLVFAAFYLARVLGALEWEALAAAALVAGGMRARGERSLRTCAAAFVAAAIGFVCAFRLVWWQTGWAGLSASGFFVPVLLLLFTALGLSAFLTGYKTGARIGPGVWDTAALLVFALGSTRCLVNIHDEAFFTGAVALIRQGGWLLWDVPSQYGFLSLALTAAVPVASAWRAVYLVNSLLLLVSAAAVYAALRRVTRGWTGVLFSALLAQAAVLLVPGAAQILQGPNPLPSVGAFRFLWVYVLLGWAAFLHARRARGVRLGRRELIFGALAWACACLWSCESAAYASAVAWPVFAMAAYELARSGRRDDAAFAALAPVGAGLAAVAAVEVFYRARLGHGPDWRCFVEYVLVYQGGFGAMPIRPNGAVAVLAWAGVLLIALAAVALRRAPAAKWLLVPAFGGFWATASYFVSRSHDSNALNLTPLWLFALVLSFSTADESWPSVRVLRAGALPLMAGVLMVAFARPELLAHYGATLLAGRGQADLERGIGLPDHEVLSLLDRARVPESDAIAFLSQYLLHRPEGPERAPAVPRLWLAMAPAPELSVLPVERQRIYVARSLQRSRAAGEGGWLLEPKDLDRPAARSQAVLAYGWGGWERLVNPRPAGLYEEILAGHRAARVLESAHWRLTRFVPRSRADAP